MDENKVSQRFDLLRLLLIRAIALGKYQGFIAATSIIREW
jgi:hypothetical protein